MSKRVRRIAFVATVVATMGLVAPAFAASSGTKDTTLGQTMSASITSPADQAHFTVGNSVTVSGQVSLTGGPVIPTNVTYIIDTSGSTQLDCVFPPDGRDVLTCEKQGAVALNGSLSADPNVQASVVGFDSTATPPSPFVVASSPTVAANINSLSNAANGGTNYDDALSSLVTGNTGLPAGNRKVAFFLSDGEPSTGAFTTGPGSPLADAAALGIVINTYSVGDGALRCAAAGSALKVISDTTGGQCNDVADPSTLAANLTNARIDVKMNGRATIPATVNGNSWTATFNSTNGNTVVLGNNPIVATATAPDGTKLDVNITIIGDPLPTTTTTTVQIVQVTPRFTG